MGNIPVLVCSLLLITQYHRLRKFTEKSLMLFKILEVQRPVLGDGFLLAEPRGGAEYHMMRDKEWAMCIFWLLANCRVSISMTLFNLYLVTFQMPHKHHSQVKILS